MTSRVYKLENFKFNHFSLTVNVLRAMSSSASSGNKKSIYYKALFVLDSFISVNLLRKS